MNNMLAELMGKRKIKISDVARGTGLSRTTITDLYYEKSKNISFETLDRLCTFFACDVGEILRSSSLDEKRNNDRLKEQ